VDGLFTTYYTLLAKDQLSSGEAKRLEELKVQLRDRKHLGETLREEILYEIIDKTLALKKHQQPQVQASQIKKEVVDEVFAIWQKTLQGTDQG
jgi:hypothetical protein